MTTTLEPGRDYVVVRKDDLGWISVEHDLPDDDETVLVYSPAASEPVWPGYRDGDVWRWADGVQAHGVTAWTAMPEGPR